MDSVEKMMGVDERVNVLDMSRMREKRLDAVVYVLQESNCYAEIQRRRLCRRSR
jgi:hypothetical protein